MKIFEIVADYNFKIKDDDIVNIEFRDCNLKGFSAVSFSRNGRVDVTGGGNAFLIFNHVMDKIKEFCSKNTNQGIAFESASSDSSRVELYLKFTQKIAKLLKMKYDFTDSGYSYVYVLHKSSKKVSSAISIIDEDGFDIDGN